MCSYLEKNSNYELVNILVLLNKNSKSPIQPILLEKIYSTLSREELQERIMKNDIYYFFKLKEELIESFECDLSLQGYIKDKKIIISDSIFKLKLEFKDDFLCHYFEKIMIEYYDYIITHLHNARDKTMFTTDRGEISISYII